MIKRVIQSGATDIYTFESIENGMLVTKNGKDLGVHPMFELGENTSGDYLIELALEL